MEPKELIAALKNDTRAWQLIQHGLKDLGLYQGTLLGAPGPKTLQALDAWFREPNALVSDLKKKIVALALKERGTLEEDDNSGPRILYYQRATDLPGTHWPYCAAFVCRIIWDALVAIYGPTPDSWPFRRPTTAGAWAFRQWAEKEATNGVQLFTKGAIKAGDIVVFKISHIGIAVEDEVNGTVKTVEGNTDPAGGRDGDGVWPKTRPKTNFQAWIRLM